eukprot:745268-Rhodomonas_salina.1
MSGMLLRICYGMSGTTTEYHATSLLRDVHYESGRRAATTAAVVFVISQALSSYAHSTVTSHTIYNANKSVLKTSMLLPGGRAGKRGAREGCSS